MPIVCMKRASCASPVSQVCYLLSPSKMYLNGAGGRGRGGETHNGIVKLETVVLLLRGRVYEM